MIVSHGGTAAIQGNPNEMLFPLFSPGRSDLPHDMGLGVKYLQQTVFFIQQLTLAENCIMRM